MIVGNAERPGNAGWGGEEDMGRTSLRSAGGMGALSYLFIVYGVLRGYLRHPLWFLVSALASVPGFRRSVSKDFSEKWADPAVLTAWMYIRLKNKIGAKKAFELLRAAFLPAALAVFGATFKIVESPRTFENMIGFHEMALQGLFSNAKEDVVERTSSRFEYRCSSCGYVDLFRYLGVPELAPMFCSVDNVFYNSYAPNEVTFSRGGLGKTLAEGAPYCAFIYENHAE